MAARRGAAVGVSLTWQSGDRTTAIDRARIGGGRRVRKAERKGLHPEELHGLRKHRRTERTCREKNHDGLNAPSSGVHLGLPPGPLTHHRPLWAFPPDGRQPEAVRAAVGTSIRDYRGRRISAGTITSNFSGKVLRASLSTRRPRASLPGSPMVRQ